MLAGSLFFTIFVLHSIWDIDMKRHLFQVIAGLVSAMALFSCQKAPVLELSGSPIYSFSCNKEERTVSFTTNRDWSVSSSESWCRIVPSSGSGSDEPITVTLTCDANTSYDARSATLTIKAEELTQTLTVNQETNYGFVLPETEYTVSCAEQILEVRVNSNVPFMVEIDAAAQGWISRTESKTLSENRLFFLIAANESYDNREGKITVTQTENGNLSQTFTVKQKQTDALFVTTPEYNLSDESHTLSVEVQANVSFEVRSEADWIHYVETKGLKSSTITLEVDANDTFDDRSGKVTVKQSNGSLTGEIIVNQVQNLGLFVGPEVVEISNEAQTVDVEVNANVEYSIVIPDTAKDWVSVQTAPDTKALTAETVTFAIAENPAYFGRETAIAFRQKDGELTGTVKLVQAQTDYLSITPQKDSLKYEGGAVSLSVITNIGYSLEPVQGAEWITVGEPEDNGEKDGLTTFVHTLSAPENERTAARYAVIHVNSATGETLQEFTLAQGPQPVVPFKDAHFAAYCVENFDTDGDGLVSLLEARSITKIDVYNKEIASLQGIECMPNLTSLDFGKNQVSSLDTSHNPALTKLGCYSNSLTSIDVSGNPALTELSFGNNRVSTLDVSHNPALTKLEFYNNAVTALDVSHNPALTELSCGKNQISVLDVSACPELSTLYCAENPYLTVIWLATGQAIANFSYDTEKVTVKYK